MGPVPPMGFPPFVESPRNGAGIAALVLGLIGASIAGVPFLFWAGAILGVLAVVFGVVGIGRARNGAATNKTMAIVGTVFGGLACALAVVGLLLTVGVIDKVKKDIDEEERKRDTTASAPPSPSDESGDLDEDRKSADKLALDFGKTASYRDGLKVTVSRPEEVELGKYAAKDGFVAYKVEITVENGTGKDVDLELTQVKARDGDGAGIERTYDFSKGPTFNQGIKGRPHPGKSVTGTYIYLMPEKKAHDRMEISVEPGVITYKEATWTGAVK
ncbi:hypothetical protein CTZ27_34485 [Streptomyces griseocarneus]|nr:hypothetical protein CTZ27_34485 [Streptomyces griseocarneus]